MSTVIQKKISPVTPSQRGLVKNLKTYEDTGERCKSLIHSKRRTSGRDNKGHITCRHKGGAHKRAYRIIQFKWSKEDYGSSFEVVRIEYDPNRNVPIALIKGKSGNCLDKLYYIIRAENLNPGMIITLFEHFTEILPGNRMCLKSFPVGSFVHCVELKPGGGAQLARSAGTSVQVAGRDGMYVLLRLPSGETRRIHQDALASVGQVDNKEFANQTVGKAGRSRWLGVRPTVRGVAMNPVDHPHGGGEGKTSGGGHPRSPWGKNCKGKITRSNKRTNFFIVTSRRRNKK